MKPALRNGMIVGLMAVAGVAGWGFLQIIEPKKDKPGKVVIVERIPSGTGDATDQVAAGPAPAGQSVGAQETQQDQGTDATNTPAQPAAGSGDDEANAAAKDPGFETPTDQASATTDNGAPDQGGDADTAGQGDAAAQDTALNTPADADDVQTNDAEPTETKTGDGTAAGQADDTADPNVQDSVGQTDPSAQADDRANVGPEQPTKPADAEPEKSDTGQSQTQSDDRADPAGETLAAAPSAQDVASPDRQTTPAQDADTTQDDAQDDANTDVDATPEDPLAPRFDVVRIESDGQAVVAGRAPPNTTVEILLDGQVVGTAVTDPAGAFVTVVFASLTNDAQSLQLRVTEKALEPAIPVPGAPAALQQPNVAGDGEVAGQPLAPSVQAKAPERPAGGDKSSVEAAPAAQEATSPAAPEAAVPPQPGAPADDTGPAVVAADLPIAPDALTVTRLDENGAPVDAAPKTPGTVAKGRYKLSAPIIILPGEDPDAAPALVKPKPESVELLQPTVTRVDGVVLDRITYSDAGDVQLQGRGRAGRAVRIYGNGLIIGTTQVAQDGTWSMALDRDRGKQIKLFRFDELSTGGAVERRIETPFTYSSLSPQVVRERRVVVQRGDALWRIAEQFYGEGIRYSLIYGANDTLIRDPDLIYPGQVFSIPELVDAN